MVTLEVKFESNVNWSHRRNSWWGKVDTARQAVRGTQWRHTHWCKWGRSLQRKDKHVLAVVTVAKIFTEKELSEIYHNTERAKGKMLEGNPNLVMNLTICHDIEKMFAPYLNYTMRRQALFKLLLICFYFAKKQTL